MTTERICEFIETWKDRGNEDQDCQSFWFDLFQKVLGVEHPTEYLNFEKRVDIDGKKKKIDVYIPTVNALIEQKSVDKKLNRKYLQSDGSRLTPYEQARRYGQFLPYSETPRWFITSNFEEIWVYDNNKPGSPPEIIKTAELKKDYTRLSFLINKKDEHVEREKELSVKAGELVGKLYDALLREYQNPTDEKTLESLNVLIVRLVFLLYADDSGIFENNQFLKYMEMFRDNPGVFRRELKTLFDVLDTPVTERDPYLDKELADFPYVNGGLFAGRGIEIPRFNEDIIGLLLDKASAGFDWSGISPTIFGAVFESTLNAETRRAGGMHYTSIENIHKVIDPLFLNDLKHELIEIKGMENIRGSKTRALNRFIDKLAGIKVLDKTTPRLIQFHTLKNAANPPFLGGFSIFGTVAA